MIRQLFDYQHFEKNVHLETLIDTVQHQYELDVDESKKEEGTERNASRRKLDLGLSEKKMAGNGTQKKGTAVSRTQKKEGPSL